MIDLLIYENRYQILGTSIMTWRYNYWMLFYLWVLDTYYPGTQEWRNKSLSGFPGTIAYTLSVHLSWNFKSSIVICLPVFLKSFIFSTSSTGQVPIRLCIMHLWVKEIQNLTMRLVKDFSLPELKAQMNFSDQFVRCRFSLPEPKAQVSFSDQFVRCRFRRRRYCFRELFTFSSSSSKSIQNNHSCVQNTSLFK